MGLFQEPIVDGVSRTTAEVARKSYRAGELRAGMTPGDKSGRARREQMTVTVVLI